MIIETFLAITAALVCVAVGYWLRGANMKADLDDVGYTRVGKHTLRKERRDERRHLRVPQFKRAIEDLYEEPAE